MSTIRPKTRNEWHFDKIAFIVNTFAVVKCVYNFYRNNYQKYYVFDVEIVLWKKSLRFFFIFAKMRRILVTTTGDVNI